jgi:hypothetical protein
MQFKNAFDVLLKAVDSVGTVLLVGGEPLLHSELPEILAYAAENDKVLLVNIVTNCTIIPSLQLINAAKAYKDKVFFGLSNYSGNPELASVLKRAEITAILKENDIKHTLDAVNVLWFRYDLQECSYSDEQMRKIFTACQWHHCLYILDDVLGICPRSIVGQKLGAFEMLENEVCNLHGDSPDNLRHTLKDLYKKNILSACRWCLRHQGNITAAVQEK